MTIKEMASRLGIDGVELEVLKAQESAGSLPGQYLHLSDYLGSQVIVKQNETWANLLLRFQRIHSAIDEIEEVDKFQDKFAVFLETL